MLPTTSMENNDPHYRAEIEELRGKSAEELRAECARCRSSIDSLLRPWFLRKEGISQFLTSFSTYRSPEGMMETGVPDFGVRLESLLEAVSLRIDTMEDSMSELSSLSGNTSEDALRRIAMVRYCGEKSWISNPWLETNVGTELSYLKKEWCYEMVNMLCSKIWNAEDAQYGTVNTSKERADIGSQTQQFLTSDIATSAKSRSCSLTDQHAAANIGDNAFPTGALGTPLDFFNAGVACHKPSDEHDIWRPESIPCHSAFCPSKPPVDHPSQFQDLRRRMDVLESALRPHKSECGTHDVRSDNAVDVDLRMTSLEEAFQKHQCLVAKTLDEIIQAHALDSKGMRDNIRFLSRKLSIKEEELPHAFDNCYDAISAHVDRTPAAGVVAVLSDPFTDRQDTSSCADDAHGDTSEENRDRFNDDTFGAPHDQFAPGKPFDFAGQTAKFAHDTSDVRKLSASSSSIAGISSGNPSASDIRGKTSYQGPFITTPLQTPSRQARSDPAIASQLAQPLSTVSERQLIIHNLPHNTPEADIYNALTSVCPIEDLLVRTSDTGIRYACLTLLPSAKLLDVQNAVHAFDGKWYNDYQLSVQRADEVERWIRGSTRAPTDPSPLRLS